MNLQLIRTEPESHVYSQFTFSLRQALEELGHRATVSDQTPFRTGTGADATSLVRELADSKYDAAISFSSFYESTVLGAGTSIFDALGVKFLGWQLDHPIHVSNNLLSPMANRHSIYSNHNHQRFAAAVKISGKAKTMLPGGVLREGIKSYRAREWPVFVAATWNGVPPRFWEPMPDTPSKRLYQAVIDRLEASLEASLLDAFNQAMRQLGLNGKLGADRDFDRQMMEFLRAPLTYLRHVDRIRIIEALADSGIPLTICGTGWAYYLGGRPNVRYLDSARFEEMPTLYENAKEVMNLNAGNGGCERAIQAMLSGSAVVSEFSKDLSDGFRLGEEIAFFVRPRPSEAVAAVRSLLDSDKGEAIAAKGHEKAIKSALWRHRAEALVEFLA